MPQGFLDCNYNHNFSRYWFGFSELWVFCCFLNVCRLNTFLTTIDFFYHFLFNFLGNVLFICTKTVLRFDFEIRIRMWIVLINTVFIFIVELTTSISLTEDNKFFVEIKWIIWVLAFKDNKIGVLSFHFLNLLDLTKLCHFLNSKNWPSDLIHSCSYFLSS